ncbi:alpha/beta hydrolase [Paracraurococcus lichenis]|uniref:Alpha/beta hydrolase-fold protein n=1 Tax=Paracraurococcus lichenis TaxID=3064888 RepID=A0ABT9E8V2_9PROT|nr:alpha/beta hydrolase-fold protein [Paracraurococcus sp. LOR1-02]MDO9712631.1 alpha/beta hydrolase-fold protein [Paracraurococcus sp. LOR1-02]
MEQTVTADHAAGIIAARPGPAPEPGARWPLPPGQYPLGLGGGRDGLLRVPAAAAPGPLPLIVMLHGATGDAARALRRIAPIADAALVVLPDSLGRSWDILDAGYGPDVARIDAALARVFAAWPVDPRRVAIAGFSDGASYALSLALMNRDLFTHALAFSPGFVAPTRLEGRPRLFLSHGTRDRVLNIDVCSRRLVPKLRQSGYPLIYREFEGGHEVPEDIAVTALAFLMAN